MARGKTFTGCWTCRDRRLKCDEARPRCVRCSAGGFDCAGYGTRLHWLDPLSLSSPSSASAEGRNTAEKGWQRRRLLPANGIMQLTDEQVDHLLSRVDEDGIDSQQGVHGPFSVFRATCAAAIATADLASTTGAANEDDDPVSRGRSISDPFAHIMHRGFASEKRLQSVLGISSPIASKAVQDPNSESRSFSRAHDSIHHSSSVSNLTPHSQTLQCSTFTSPVSPDSFVFSEVSSPTCGSAQCLTNRPKFLTAQVKHLLNHYRDHVLPFFSVLDNPHTPWRVLHFPKALQAACETEIRSAPDGPSKVLLYAILTISAYSLQNREAKGRNRRASSHWEGVAAQYRGQALTLLKVHVGTHSRKMRESEYEELLAAVLSMVTIDVMCGDTRTCEVHLEACEALIQSHMENRGYQASRLARALHTTFVYLRIMQYAATVNSPGSYMFHSEHAQTNAGFLHNDDFRSFIEPAEPDESQYDSFSSEMIYGFPVRLLLLLRSTIRLAHTIRQTKDSVASSGLPRDLQAGCDQLEDSILDWPVEAVITEYKEVSLNPGHCEIMEHYTRAFHVAIIIYFFDQIHHTRRRLLQQYVQSVIHHLEQIEVVKSKYGIVAGPILWPAFIAASQATDSTTRSRFLSWLDSGDTLGVGTSQATVRLLQQLWKTPEESSGQDLAIAISQQRLVLT